MRSPVTVPDTDYRLRPQGREVLISPTPKCWVPVNSVLGPPLHQPNTLGDLFLSCAVHIIHKLVTFKFPLDGNSLYFLVVVVVSLTLKTHRTIHLKMIDFALCKLDFNTLISFCLLQQCWTVLLESHRFKGVLSRQ